MKNETRSASSLIVLHSRGGSISAGKIAAIVALFWNLACPFPSLGANRPIDADSYRRVAFVGTAVVKSTAGQVEFLCKNNWLPAKTSQIFTCEQVCRVKPGGSATFQMRTSGALVRVSENTLVRFCPLEERMPVASLTGHEAVSGWASVRAVRGNAEYLNEHSKWQPVRVNSSLAVGTTVRTLENTIVDLFFADSGLVLRINPDSRVTLNQFPFVEAGEIQTNRKAVNLLANLSSR